MLARESKAQILRMAQQEMQRRKDGECGLEVFVEMSGSLKVRSNCVRVSDTRLSRALVDACQIRLAVGSAALRSLASDLLLSSSVSFRLSSLHSQLSELEPYIFETIFIHAQGGSRCVCRA